MAQGQRAKAGEATEHPGKHKALTVFINGFIHQ